MSGLTSIRSISEIDRWIPPRELEAGIWPEVPVGEIADEIREPPIESDENPIISLCGVRWYGKGLYRREERPLDEIGGNSYRLKPGALVYNRLFGWKMAFATVTDEFAGAAVSGEFPQYHLDPSEVDLAYMQLVCSRPSFAERVLDYSTGSTAQSRNRLYQQDFEDLTLPLPPVKRQREIVGAFDATSTEAEALTDTAANTESAAWREFEEAVGYQHEPALEIPQAFIASSVHLDRWDDEDVYRSLVDQKPVLSKFPLVPLAKVARVRLGMQKGPENRPKDNAYPYLRSANVGRGRLHLDDVWKIEVKDSQLSGLALMRGDLLFVEGSGSRDAIGRCAVWNEEINPCVHQNSIVRARPDPAQLDPNFAMGWFNSRPGRRHIYEVATTTSGLHHIGANGVATAPVPKLALDLQIALATQLLNELEESESLLRASVSKRREAFEEFELAVFGRVSSAMSEEEDEEQNEAGFDSAT